MSCGGCRFNVRPVPLPDASVPSEDLLAEPVDDLSEALDLSSAPDFAASPDLLASADLRPLPPDLAHNCGDNVKNGDESDTDCGGSCPKCSDGRACGGGPDCLSTHCLLNKCVQCTTGTQCGAPLEFCVKNICDAIA